MWNRHLRLPNNNNNSDRHRSTCSTFHRPTIVCNRGNRIGTRRCRIRLVEVRIFLWLQWIIWLIKQIPTDPNPNGSTRKKGNVSSKTFPIDSSPLQENNSNNSINQRVSWKNHRHISHKLRWHTSDRFKLPNISESTVSKSGWIESIPQYHQHLQRSHATTNTASVRPVQRATAPLVQYDSAATSSGATTTFSLQANQIRRNQYQPPPASPARLCWSALDAGGTKFPPTTTQLWYDNWRSQISMWKTSGFEPDRPPPQVIFANSAAVAASQNRQRSFWRSNIRRGSAAAPPPPPSGGPVGQSPSSPAVQPNQQPSAQMHRPTGWQFYRGVLPPRFAAACQQQRLVSLNSSLNSSIDNGAGGGYDQLAALAITRQSVA